MVKRSLFSGYNDTGPQVPGTSGKIQGAKAPKTIGAEGTTNNTRASECPTSKMDALLREAMLSGMFNVESRAVTKAASTTTTLYLPPSICLRPCSFSQVCRSQAAPRLSGPPSGEVIALSYYSLLLLLALYGLQVAAHIQSSIFVVVSKALYQEGGGGSLPSPS